jgi:hypothetical protein
MSGWQRLTVAIGMIAFSCCVGADARAQSAAQLRKWQDWCDGRNGATAEQTAEGCVNLMQSKAATSVPPAPAPLEHKPIARVPPHQVATPSAAAPEPSLGDDASSADFLQAARGAIAAGRLREAKDALERAESRVLTRSESVSDALLPSRQQLVQQIADARDALQSGDRMRTLDLIDQAVRNPEIGEPAQ